MTILHHDDLDGRCSAAIVLKYLKEHNRNIDRVLEVGYNDELTKDIFDDEVWILDFHLEDDELFKELQDYATKVLLIDHHKTTVQHKQEHPELYKHIKAIVQDKSGAACKLIWEHLYDGQLPGFVECISLYDTWEWIKHENSDDILAVITGLQLHDTSPQADIWCTLFDGLSASEGMKLLSEGRTCIKFRERLCADYIDKYSWETMFEGHKALAQGIYAFGSLAFADKLDEYDVCISYEYLGNKWIVGLYSNTVDVSELAIKHGGGGHRGAAGFTCEVLPFNYEQNKVY